MLLTASLFSGQKETRSSPYNEDDNGADGDLSGENRGKRPLTETNIK